MTGASAGVEKALRHARVRCDGDLNVLVHVTVGRFREEAL